MTRQRSVDAARLAQLRRMREVWLTSQPTPDEIRRVYQRWSSGHVSGRRRAYSPGLLALATLFVGGGALALTGVLRPSTQASSLALPSPDATAVRAGAKGRYALPSTLLSTAPSPQSMPEPAGAQGEQAPSLSVPTASPDVHDVGVESALPEPSAASPSAAGPSVANSVVSEGHRSAPVARAVAKPNSPEIARTVPPSEQPRVQRSSSVRASSPVLTPELSAAVEAGSWSRVAEAMREGDPQRVNAALDNLRQSSDLATRDAARLTRAQLAIADGSPELVRAELHDLAAHGASPMIRRRARDMIQRLP